MCVKTIQPAGDTELISDTIILAITIESFTRDNINFAASYVTLTDHLFLRTEISIDNSSPISPYRQVKPPLKLKI